MGLVLYTAPTTFPVTLAEAQAQTKAYEAADEDHLNALISSASNYVETYLGRSLMPQTWELVIDAFFDSILLPRGPVQLIDAVTYYDPDGNLQTLSSSIYLLDNTSDPAWMVLRTGETWPVTLAQANAVTIRYDAGYTSVPTAISMAVKFLISQWYDNRTPFSERTPTELPNAVASLLANHRAFGF